MSEVSHIDTSFLLTTTRTNQISQFLFPIHPITQFNNSPFWVHLHVSTPYTVVSVCRIEVEVLLGYELVDCIYNLFGVYHELSILQHRTDWIASVVMKSLQTAVVVSSYTKKELHEDYCALHEVQILQIFVSWVIQKLTTIQSCLFTRVCFNTV